MDDDNDGSTEVLTCTAGDLPHLELTPSDLEVPWERCYDSTVNPGVDVFAITTAIAAFESAIPSTVRVLLDEFEPADEVITVNTAEWPFHGKTKANSPGFFCLVFKAIYFLCLFPEMQDLTDLVDSS